MKFANVTYGTHGDSAEYTYLVNDNVKAGEVLQPSVIHYQSKKVFATTGIVQNFPESVSSSVEGKVVKNGKGKKIKIFTYKQKKTTTRKKQGHRQPYTKVEITKIK